MTNWYYRDQAIIFSLAKTILHYPTIQACLDNLIRRPVHAIGNDDILAKAIKVPADSVMVLAKNHV